MGGNTEMAGSLLRAGLDLGRGAASAQVRDGGRDDLARAAMIQARGRAGEERDAAREEASQAQERARRNKARRMSSHGASGLALSGSPLLAAVAGSVADQDSVQAALDQGRARAADVEAQGLTRAAALRRRNGSLLSLGGSLWDAWQD
jgi:hypothetical protein